MTSPRAGADRPIEVELKYRVRDEVVAQRILAADVLAGFHARGSARASQEEDRYLDTADGALARAGFAARLRQRPGDTIVSVKSTARGKGRGALHRREELEGPADRTLEPRDWPPSAARSLILELCGDAPLVELVTVRQLRHRRRLGERGTVVELSVDEVDVVARGRLVDRFIELEVELVSGDERTLESVRHALARDEGLRTSSTSKLDAALAAAKRARRGGSDARSGDGTHADLGAIIPGAVVVDERDAHDHDGSAAANGSPEAVGLQEADGSVEAGAAVEAGAPVEAGGPEEPGGPQEAGGAEEASDEPEVEEPITNQTESPVRSEPDPAEERPSKSPGVAADDLLSEAGRKVLRFQLARMIEREAGTRDGRDLEQVHGMRVATRRLRAAWRVFGEAYRAGRTKRYRKPLRDVARRLGAVRDMDVQLEAIDAYRADLPPGERQALEPLVAAWTSYREEARVLLLRELDSDAFKVFVDDFKDFVRAEGAASRAVAPTEPHRVRDTTPSRIWRAYEQVRSYEAVLRWADVTTLHDLRIAAKWLRYSLEFVRETLGPDATPLIKRVVALQDHLGQLHDADVAAHSARAFLVEQGSALSDVESAAIGRYLVNREREVGRLRRSVGAPWRGVAGLSFRRGLARTLADL